MSPACLPLGPRTAPDLSLEDYLRRVVPDYCQTGQRVIDIMELSAGVWAVELQDGSRIVAKHQAFGAFNPGRDSTAAPCADDLLVVEPKVLDILGEHHCPVPGVLAVDEETRFIFFEHRGEHTLDDVVQASGVSRDLSRKLVAGFCNIERVLAKHHRDLVPLASTAATGAHLPQAASRASAQSQEGLARILGLCATPGGAGDSLEPLLDGLCTMLSQREPTLASTDFNARNVVIDAVTDAVSFIEFAKIGWDWPERRLVQYATSLGAGRVDGSFICCLGPEALSHYARFSGDGGGALDGHHILFHLQAAAVLCRALERPALPRHRALLQAWQRPRHRLRQLVDTLVQPLTVDTQATEFRWLLAQAVHPFIEGDEP